MYPRTPSLAIMRMVFGSVGMEHLPNQVCQRHSCTLSTRIIKYNYRIDKLKVVDAPMFAYQQIWTTILMTTRDGVLGYTSVVRYKLHLWLREATCHGKALTWV
jgi:hypothetical protein